MSNSLLLTVENIHSPECGVAPSVTVSGTGEHYHGFFTGICGDQWIFSYDRSTNRGTLRGGDLGWDTVQEVVDGTVPGLVMDGCEAAWLQACWAAATASPMWDGSCNLLAWVTTLARQGVPAAILRDLAQKAVALADEVDVGRQP